MGTVVPMFVGDRAEEDERKLLLTTTCGKCARRWASLLCRQHHFTAA
jgi:hypothetical protein